MGGGRAVRGVGRALAWVIALAGSLLAVVLLAPDRLGLTMTTPFAQVIAFRGALGLASLALGVLLFASVGSSRRRRRRARRGGSAPAAGAEGPRGGGRRRPSPVAALAVVLLLTGAAHVGVLASRGVVNAPPTTASAPASAAATKQDLTPGALTVLAFNTYVGSTPAAAVAAVALAAGADVVALPETPPEVAAEIATRLAEAGNPMQVFTNDRGYSTVFTTSLLVSDAWGRYEEVATQDGVGYVRADPVDGAGPPIVAVHPSAPSPSNMDWWARELEYAVDLCRRTPGAVVAGDFNATLDHAPMHDLGGCIDAAAAAGSRGAGAFGTWNALVPALLGAPIDHVLADGAAWAVDAVGVVEVGDSDHRGIVARLVPLPAPSAAQPGPARPGPALPAPSGSRFDAG